MIPNVLNNAATDVIITRISFLNHTPASFPGEFNINGWAIPAKNCPT